MPITDEIEIEIGNPLRATRQRVQFLFCMKTLPRASNGESFSFPVIVGADVR